MLEASGFEYRYNPHQRRLKAGEVAECVRDAHGLIAGTEHYSREVLEQARNLEVIARVGVGLDNIDFDYCRERGIVVTYTAEAPADGVAELTVGNIINLVRHVLESDRSVRERAWNRLMGSLVREVKIGILGVGRIGKRVVRLLQPFKPRIYGCDIDEDRAFGEEFGITWLSKEALFSTCDVVSVHVPLTEATRGFIGRRELRSMPRGGLLINTSRGPVLDDDSLIDVLRQGHLGGAALDVFHQEPYDGPLVEFDNVVLTAHIGASARGSRLLMELGAAEDCVRVLSGQAPREPVTAEVLGRMASTGRAEREAAEDRRAAVPES